MATTSSSSKMPTTPMMVRQGRLGRGSRPRGLAHGRERWRFPRCRRRQCVRCAANPGRAWCWSHDAVEFAAVDDLVDRAWREVGCNLDQLRSSSLTAVSGRVVYVLKTAEQLPSTLRLRVAKTKCVRRGRIDHECVQRRVSGLRFAWPDAPSVGLPPQTAACYRSVLPVEDPS